MPADRSHHDPLSAGGRRASRVPPGDLRASDAERHQVEQELSSHYAEGRLDDAELQERLAQVAAAKTRRQLAGVLDDLPPVGEEEGPGPEAASPAPPRRPYRRHPVLAAVLVVVCIAAFAPPLAFAAHHIWPLWLVALVLFVLWRRRRCGWRA